MSQPTPKDQANWENSFLSYWKNASAEFRQKMKGALGTAAGGSFDYTGGFGKEAAAAEYRSGIESQIKLMQALGEASDQVTAARRKLQEVSYDLFGTIENGQRATEALTEQMRTFGFMTEEVQTSLGRATMVLDKFGVNMSTTGEILDTAAMAFGFSQDKLQKLAEGLAEVVYKFPGQASQIARNFQAAQSSLAYDSKKIMEVFKKLQMTSSTTGVSFNKLTAAFGDSMDTFEGSASKAGNLNAILGRSVFNSIDLLGKTEAQRVDTIVKGVQRSIGGDVNRLGKFQLKAVAEGMGLSVEDTRRLLSGQTTPEAVMKDKKDPKTLLQEQAKEATNANTMSLDKLTNTMKSYQGLLERTRIAAQAEIRRGFMKGAGFVGSNEASPEEAIARQGARILFGGKDPAGMSPAEIRKQIIELGDPVKASLQNLKTAFSEFLPDVDFKNLQQKATEAGDAIKKVIQQIDSLFSVNTPTVPQRFGLPEDQSYAEYNLKLQQAIDQQGQTIKMLADNQLILSQGLTSGLSLNVDGLDNFIVRSTHKGLKTIPANSATGGGGRAG